MAESKPRSNCFNMAALIPLHLIVGGVPCSAGWTVRSRWARCFGALLMGLALMDVLNEPERRVWFIEPGPALMLVTYLAGLSLTYRVSD